MPPQLPHHQTHLSFTVTADPINFFRAYQEIFGSLEHGKHRRGGQPIPTDPKGSPSPIRGDQPGSGLPGRLCSRHGCRSSFTYPMSLPTPDPTDFQRRQRFSAVSKCLSIASETTPQTGDRLTERPVPCSPLSLASGGRTSLHTEACGFERTSSPVAV